MDEEAFEAMMKASMNEAVEFFQNSATCKVRIEGGVVTQLGDVLRSKLEKRRVEYRKRHETVLDEKGLQFVLTDNTKRVSKRTTDLLVKESTCTQMGALQLGEGFKRIVKIIIGDHCCAKVGILSLSNLPSLREVTVGLDSFTENGNGPRSFSINACSSLLEVTIGDGSFRDYCSMELHNLPCFRTLVLGKGCFLSTPVFSLRGRKRAIVTP